MNQHIFKLIILIGLLAALVSTRIFANGINPPRPHEASIVKADCKSKTQTNGIEIYRAKIKKTSGDELIHLRTGTFDEAVPMASIKYIEFTDSIESGDGYLEAKFLRTGSDIEETGAVQVKSANADVIVSGFSMNGSPVRVRLLDCSVIHFTAPPNRYEESDRGPKA